jgi:hypothetical protein
MTIKHKIKGLAVSLSIIALVPAVALAGAGTFQAVDAHFFGTTDPANGAGTLTRHANSIQLSVAMTGLEASASYSAWYVIFNRPDQCAGGPGACNGGDIGNPAVRAGVLNAGGFISTVDGTGYFAGTLQTGQPPAGLCCFGRLMHGYESEVHIVLQTHGPAVPGTVAAEITQPTGLDQFAIVFPSTK